MKTYSTYSDGGCVKIGIDNGFIRIANGYGDGETIVRVLNENEEKPEDAVLLGEINSDQISVYEFDYGKKVLFTLKGRYGILRDKKEAIFNGNLYFQKWSDQPDEL